MDYSLITNLNFKISSLKDLPILKTIMETNDLRPNFTRIAKMLDVDRRTVKKYYDGYKKKEARKRKSKIDSFRPIIDELLAEESIKRFYTKRILWSYLCNNYGLVTSYSNFRNFILKNPEYQEYFDKKRGKKKIKKKDISLRFETAPGEQAQIDWKEDIEYITKDGEIIKLNVFSIVLGYSRYKVFLVSFDRRQDILLEFLTQAFEIIGGVPKVIVNDNMKTIMNEARSRNNEGVINNKYYQFSKDFGFKVRPCMARRAKTKGKVEVLMKLIEEIHAYQGDLDYKGLIDLVEKINNRVNMDIHQTTGKIPLNLLKKEKDHLMPLPKKSIRDLYKLEPKRVKVNNSSMVTYKQNQYSVPTEYVGKILTIKVLDNKLHIYDNTKLVTIHQISTKKLNYHIQHYEEILSTVFRKSTNDEMKKMAKENLKKIGLNYEI